MNALKFRDEKIAKEIIEAAKALFSKYGLKKTTMEDVGRASRKGKSSLYYYFPGKTELFEAVVNDELQSMVTDIRKGINAETTSKGKLQAFLLVRLQSKEKRHNLGEVVSKDLFDHYREICRIKAEFETVQVEFIKEIVTGGIQGGEFRKMSAKEISLFSTWMIAAFNGLQLPSSAIVPLLSSEESSMKIIDFILYGIAK